MPSPIPNVAKMGGPTGPHQEVGAGIVGGTGEPVTVNSKTKLSWW